MTDVTPTPEEGDTPATAEDAHIEKARALHAPHVFGLSSAQWQGIFIIGLLTALTWWGADSTTVVTVSNPAALNPGNGQEIPPTQVERAPSLLEQLSRPDVARGLITLLFAMGTIWIAIQLAGRVASNALTDRQYARGKDVLTILVGLFGTIIGYYFGSAHTAKVDPPAAQNVAAQVQTVGGGNSATTNDSTLQKKGDTPADKTDPGEQPTDDTSADDNEVQSPADPPDDETPADIKLKTPPLIDDSSDVDEA